MSLHYEWVLSMRLRADVNPDFVHELRWLLGLAPDRPAVHTLDLDHPYLASNPLGHLPGGEISQLVDQDPFLDQPSQLGLYSRTFQLDDAMYEIMQSIPRWLAPQVATQGWIGSAREEMDLRTWFDFYVQDGYAYLGSADGNIRGLDADAPAFGLGGTIDPPSPPSPTVG